MNNLTIRLETEKDYRAIEAFDVSAVVFSALPTANVEQFYRFVQQKNTPSSKISHIY